MIRAIIFDLDGTLVHSLPGIAASLNRTLESYALPTHSESAVRGFIGDGMRVLIERALPHTLPDVNLDAMVTSLKHDYAQTWKDGTSPYSGVIHALHDLKKTDIGTAVLSNKPHVFCKTITDELFPETDFSTVIGQRDGIASKPDPSGALEVARILNTPAAEIAFLGDSTVDLITAKNAGMIPIAATWGYHDTPALQAEKPAFLMDQISDLLAILQKT